MKYLLPALLLPVLAFARIGETPEQMAARYGAPVEVQPTRLTYQKNGFIIIADMFSGRCYSLAFSRDGGVSPEQINTLRAANCGEQTWTDIDGSRTQYLRGVAVHRHRSGDGLYESTISGNILMIQHRNAADKVKAAADQAKRAKEAEAVSGL